MIRGLVMPHSRRWEDAVRPLQLNGDDEDLIRAMDGDEPDGGICRWCGQTLLPWASRTAQYCGPACREAGYREQMRLRRANHAKRYKR